MGGSGCARDALAMSTGSKAPEARNDGTRLYDVTAVSRLASIVEHGLGGEFTSVMPGSVYLGDTPFQVGIYNGHWDEGPCVLLSVAVTDLDVDRMGADREDLSDILDQEGDDRRWCDVPWDESLTLCGACTYGAPIPARLLQVECHFLSDDLEDRVDLNVPLLGWPLPIGGLKPR